MATAVIYSDVSDGYLNGEDTGGSYATAAGSATLANTSLGEVDVGQFFDSASTYDVWQAFLSFDTTGLIGATSAVLSLVDQFDSSVTDFTIEVRLYDWGASLTVGDWVVPANIGSQPLVASYATASGWTGAVYHDFTDVAMVANLNIAGLTRLLLNSSRHRTAVTPTGSEYAAAKSADTAGTTSDPKLTVTYTLSQQIRRRTVMAPQQRMG